MEHEREELREKNEVTVSVKRYTPKISHASENVGRKRTPYPKSRQRTSASSVYTKGLSQMLKEPWPLNIGQGLDS